MTLFPCLIVAGDLCGLQTQNRYIQHKLLLKWRELDNFTYLLASYMKSDSLAKPTRLAAGMYADVHGI